MFSLWLQEQIRQQICKCIIHCIEMCFACKGTRTGILQSSCGWWQHLIYFWFLLICLTKGMRIRSQDRAVLGGSSTPRQCRMQWEHSSPLMRPLLQRGRLNSDGYKKRPKYLNRWGWQFYFLLYVLKAEIGSALCCMSSLFPHFMARLSPKFSV